LEDPDYIFGLEGYTDEEISDIRRKTIDGMFPNDGYDYSKHIRDRGEGQVLNALEVEGIVKVGEEGNIFFLQIYTICSTRNV
jgi:hypothetical protein